MTKKQIRGLVQASYTNDELDQKKINRIVKLLNRFELKEYLKLVKMFEKSKTLTVYAPSIRTVLAVKTELSKMFKGKKVELKEDKKLIAGIKIIDNDNVYDFNLRNNLKNLVSYIVD